MFHLEWMVTMRLDRPLDEILGGRSHIRILRALAFAPPNLRLSAREVARRASLSHPTAARILSDLARQGVATVERAPRADTYRLDRRHTFVERLLPLLEWEGGIRDELIRFLREAMAGVPSVPEAYLFGSALEGPTTSSSDIDVAVVCAPGDEDRVTADLDPVEQAVRDRFGNRLSVVIGSGPLARLARGGRPGHRLWSRVSNEGVPLVDRREGRARA